LNAGDSGSGGHAGCGHEIPGKANATDGTGRKRIRNWKLPGLGRQGTLLLGILAVVAESFVKGFRSLKEKQNPILIGMPGAGKSTIGVLSAKRRGMAFPDTDILIQTGEGSYLQELISRHGISGFREIEETYLLGVPADCGVVATAGMTPDQVVVSVLRGIRKMGIVIKCSSKTQFVPVYSMYWLIPQPMLTYPV